MTGFAALVFAAGVVILILAINAQLDVQNIWPRVFV
jgi:hypothetical protein